MSHISFLGIPVEGDITHGAKRTAQRPMSELETLILALHLDSEIYDFGWTQSTPYFNDGDPCVFGADSFWVRTNVDANPTPIDSDWLLRALSKMVGFIKDEYGDLSREAMQELADAVGTLNLDPPKRGGYTDNEDDDDDFSECFSVEYGTHPTLGKLDKTYHPVPMSTYIGPDEERFMRCYAVSKAITDGHFDDALLEKFGDHCQIVITKGKITVEFYEHD